VVYLPKGTSDEGKSLGGQRDRGQANSFQIEGDAVKRQGILQGWFLIFLLLLRAFLLCERTQRDGMKSK